MVFLTSLLGMFLGIDFRNERFQIIYNCVKLAIIGDSRNWKKTTLTFLTCHNGLLYSFSIILSLLIATGLTNIIFYERCFCSSWVTLRFPLPAAGLCSLVEWEAEARGGLWTLPGKICWPCHGAGAYKQLIRG